MLQSALGPFCERRSSMNAKRFFIVVLAALLLLFAGLPTAFATPQPPPINPANFVRQVTNRNFPLRPGTTFYYQGSKEGVPANDEVYVTYQTKKILGVKC